MQPNLNTSNWVNGDPIKQKLLDHSVKTGDLLGNCSNEQVVDCAKYLYGFFLRKEIDESDIEKLRINLDKRILNKN